MKAEPAVSHVYPQVAPAVYMVGDYPVLVSTRYDKLADGRYHIRLFITVHVSDEVVMAWDGGSIDSVTADELVEAERGLVQGALALIGYQVLAPPV